jgi:hypothetical protein
MLTNQTNQDGSMAQKKPVDKKATLFSIRWVSVAIVSAILTLSGWALSSPIGSSPDDDYHLANIWCGQGFREGLCEKDVNPIIIKVPATTFSNSLCFQFDETKSGACSYDNSLKPFSRSNAVENLYPPLYYWSMSWFASEDIAASTIAMRITNSILAVLAFSLVIFLLPHHLRRIPFVSLLVSALPLGVFLIASTNPSSWAYFSMIIFFSSYLGFLNSDTYRNKWIFGSLSAVSLMLAAGSRPDAAIYAVIAIGLAILLNLSRTLFSPVNVVTSLAFVTASAYSYLSLGIGPAVVSGGLALPDQESSAPSFFVNLASLPNLWVGVFGTSRLGWVDTEMPAIVWAVTLSIYTGLIFSSVRWFSFKQSVAVSLAFLALVIIPLYILTVSGLSVGQQVQPRYLLPLIALLGATALYRGSSALGLELTRGQVWIIGAGLFVANTISLHLNARRYITGMDQQGVNLDEDIEWWWSEFMLSPNVVWLGGSVSFALFLVSIWKLRTVLGLPGDVKNNPKPKFQV